jgi:hypothetical protein
MSQNRFVGLESSPMDILTIAAVRKNFRLKNYRIDFIAGAHAGQASAGYR